MDETVIARLAELGNWKLEVNLKDRNDVVVWAGDGVDDIDRWVEHLNTHGLTKARIEQSISGLSGSWADCTVDDLLALRAEFVRLYGEVHQIDVYNNRPADVGDAVELSEEPQPDITPPPQPPPPPEPQPDEFG